MLGMHMLSPLVDGLGGGWVDGACVSLSWHGVGDGPAVGRAVEGGADAGGPSRDECSGLGGGDGAAST